MNTIQQEITRMLSDAGQLPVASTSKEPGAYERRQVERWNQKQGTLKGIDCPKCKNRGYIFRYDAERDVIFQDECSCMELRRSEQRMKASGISESMERCTFDGYKAVEPWQIKAKGIVMSWSKKPSGWLWVGGQVASGKTHLCTAALRELAKTFPVSYMMWRDDSARIKAQINDLEGIEQLDRFKKSKVLYIDDLFKGGAPSEADLRLAFEIVNYRYNRTELIAIISSEWFLSELVELDEAIGSRINERSRGNRVEIKRDKARNYRLR